MGSESPLRRCALIFTGGIGDLLLASPAIARLADSHSLDLVGNPERFTLLNASGIGAPAKSLDAVNFSSLASPP
jgi:hypothetical protein